MRDFFRYIILASALSMMLLSLNSCKEDGVIDEDDMAQIYAEMLLTDQWINTTPGVRLVAYTSLVYEPILKKYGYTSADYRKSVDYYLNDPKTYADIMKKTVKILDRRLAQLNKRKVELEEARAREQYVKNITRDLKISDSWNALNNIVGEPFGPDDSLAVEWDTIAYCFSLKRVPKVVVTDTLAVSDSLMPGDSLAVLDSLKTIDSLKTLDTLPAINKLKKPENLKIDGALMKKVRL
jgi:hypothetical protein